MGKRLVLKPVVLCILLSLSIFSPFAGFEALKSTSTHQSSSTSAQIDVPNYRIGDEWVYETKFDVAQLIAQANVSASLNTLTGDTSYTITDIQFIDDEQGQPTLVYEQTISGSFTSGNNGATLQGVTGRLDIDYSGVDILRVRDLALMRSEFTLDVQFLPFNLGIFSQQLADITFENTYSPAKERHDFPLHNGDQWNMPFNATTNVSGTSDYFDPTQFDQASQENNSWQITKRASPSENGDTPSYTGCSDSFKIVEWNETGVNSGFTWYCPAVRGSAWIQVTNPAGFTIDWLLKQYSPSDSSNVIPQSSPGTRNTAITIGTVAAATLPNATESITITYLTGPSSTPIANTNLQLRYEIASTILNPTTSSTGDATIPLNVSYLTDTTPSSDDYTSNGIVVWDPFSKIVGAATIVLDLNVVGVDLIAQSGSVIVERTRANATSVLSSSVGYNALPGDTLSFSLPAQNRGVLTSPATSMEVTTPENITLREAIPEISPYDEARLTVNWTVPPMMAIGFSTISFEIDPDENVSEDANRTNNFAVLQVFIGRSPIIQLLTPSGHSTFDEVLISANSSYDPDGGDVDCTFEIESRVGLVNVIQAPFCITSWNWSNSGVWDVKVIVTDDELDVAEQTISIEILNRPATFDVEHPLQVNVDTPVTLRATNLTDQDTTSPSGQHVIIAWPNVVCDEGETQPVCTFTPSEEGEMGVSVLGTDDDGAQTWNNITLQVLNIPPSITQPVLTVGGELIQPNSEGQWVIDEDEVGILKATASDSTLDLESLLIEWHPSHRDENWTITTSGMNSEIPIAWNQSGLHTISVRSVDGDGASSASLRAEVLIRNVPPSIQPFPSSMPVFEDEMVNLKAIVEDSPTDLKTLSVCWDLNSQRDEDGDGSTTNDCDVQGIELNTSWTQQKIVQVTANVMDDDGATASASTNISVLNIPPTAKIEMELLETTLMEGDNITLYGTQSSDSPYDMSVMAYQWDSNHFDSDLNGQTVGDIDFTGDTWNIQNLPAGTWTIVLTVIDDNGESDSTSMTFVVKAKPSDGILDSIESSIGSTATYIFTTLMLVIIILLGFMMVKPKHVEYTGDLHQSIFDASPHAPLEQKRDVFDQEFSMSTQPQVGLTPEQPSLSPTQFEPQAPTSHAGPPLPSTGLPEGWSMEQWEYYGEQWLDANSSPTPATQPIPSQTHETSASTELQSLLDDLDF